VSLIGKHCLIDLYDCPPALLDDAPYVRRVLRESVERAGATWLGEVHHRFDPHGVTAIGLLAESHISIHTWPELGYAAADVFTCGDSADPELACRLIADVFDAGRVESRLVPRATTLGVNAAAV